MLQVFV